MAALVLSVAGSAIGGSLFGPAGAIAGRLVGAIAGNLIDRSLFGGSERRVEGPRLADLDVMASTEGAPIPRLYGRARLGGQVIWATDIEEQVVTSHAGGSGKGRPPAAPSVTTVEYRYFGNFAVAIAEGEITGLGRVWADGRELDLSAMTHRLYTGSDDQLPDALIEAREGAGNAPAYRGVAYIVFEHLALAQFGNRLPQLSFEVFRAVDDFEARVRAVTMIPGGGEFVYAPEAVTRRTNLVSSTPENVHTLQGGSDWRVAINQLEATLPNVQSVSLVVGWFGTDLRAASCQVRPGVDAAQKDTTPFAWSAGGQVRASAHLVSTVEGRAAYGGTPSDASVIAAIEDLHERGLAVTFSPFVFMDVPAGNALPDPYTGAASQPVYPWRGRITVAPAPGVAGTPDQTAAAATQVAAFVGAAAPSDFTVLGSAVLYSGPAEWSYRRFILHYAHLCAAAGGVEAFIIGSELRGLTHVRSSASAYPFVTALAALADDVKAILGPATKVTYAADWSEYFGHQPPDGSGDVHFHLDPLWSSPSIDAIGIDVYWPLSDWRDGFEHADAEAGARSIYDLVYLRANITGGEGFDWYYASEADRDAQVRLPITDGGGKPWLYRYKDIKGWWENEHFDRPGGVESASPTAWVPQSKPIWFTELGCPAIDKGSNEPNVFVDPKSSESRLPHYSRGTRDDFMQRRYLQAFLTAFDPDDPAYVEGTNPASGVYAGRMVDLDHISLYTWDARPFPAFPSDTDTWGDGDNWRLGHWLTGRLANAPLDAAVAAILTDYGFTDFDASALTGSFTGLAVDRVLSAREVLQPLELAFFIDARESDGRMVFSPRGSNPTAAALTTDGLVERRAGDALATLTRGQETDLPASAKIGFISASDAYPSAVEEARRLIGHSGRVAVADLPLVLDAEQAAQTADVWLFEAWAARERATFALPPSRLALEVGDVVSLIAGGRSRLLRITDVGEHGTREIEARGIDPAVYAGVAAPVRTSARGSPTIITGQPLALFLDLPLLRGDEPPAAGYVAAAQEPWPGSVAFYRAPETSGFQLKALAEAPAITGVTLDPLPIAPSGRIVAQAGVRVHLDRGTLASVTTLALLGGANAAAIQNADGDWEVLQFRSAVLTAPSTYRLSDLLRGQAGTEHAMRSPLPAGARFVLLDAAVVRADTTEDELALAFTWRCGPAGRDIGDASYVDATHAFRSQGLRPLSPVHLWATRSGGDVTLRWVRRTRIGGDSWETTDVPLGETSELYEIDILDGATVVRTLTASGPSALYTAAQQTADFGSPQASISLRIYQLGATYGRGTPASATL
jgi:hypothetical protein